MSQSALPAAARSESMVPAAARIEVGTGVWLTAARSHRLVWGFLLLGLAARAIRYLLRFPLWDDETFLCVNFIDAGFADLLRPLQFHQVAPLLFLWLELGCAKLLGFNEWSLRLPAFLAGIGSLFLFRHLAGRLLSGAAQVSAMAIFAVSYGGIRYSAEAKPYGIDLFAALVLLVLAVEFQRRPEQTRWLWLAAAFAPLAVGLSFPAAFIGGGVSLFVAATLWFRKRRLAIEDGPGWLAWTLFNATLVGAFAGFYWLSAQNQAAAEGRFMDECWQNAFPPLSEPWRLPFWLLQIHTSDLLAFPIGGQRGASSLTAVACGAGIAMFLRRREWRLLLLCLSPLMLNLLAAALHRYPYGGHVKFAMYASPAICLLAGCCAAALFSACRSHATEARWQRGLLAALALVAVGSMARDFARPYKTQSDSRSRDFARWFWRNAEFAGEAVCLKSDLGIDFSPPSWHELTWAAMYRCNQAIYSPRHARHEPANLDRVTADWPLRCVEFRSGFWPHDEAARQRWLQSMLARYDLASQDSIPQAVYGKQERTLLCVDHVDIYKFVPKRAPAIAAPAEEGNLR